MIIDSHSLIARHLIKRNRILLVAVLLVLILFGLINGHQVLGQQKSFSSREIDQYLQKQMTANHIPGMAVAIVRNEEIIYLKGFGFASLRRHSLVTPRTVFDLASCSKAFTALAVLLLWHDGDIDLDRPFYSYLPEFRLADEDTSF